MKDYPSIAGEYIYDIPLYAFDKLDGSNIRAEWSAKRGFYKFGSRTQLLDRNSGYLNEAPQIVLDTYGDHLGNVFRAQKYESAVAFFEFYGPNSLAGSHTAEPHRVTLFDVSPYKKGILPPRVFLDLFGHLDIPNIVFEGFLTEDLVQGVREGTLPGITCEGVVCKGRADRKTEVPVMFKIKTHAWLDKLRAHCGDNKTLFEMLK